MPQIKKTVIASYYPWYHDKSWQNRVDRPLAGEYNSMTKETIARHSQLAVEAGIDVFATEWSGRDHPDTERHLKTLLDELHALRSPVKVSLMYAVFGNRDPQFIIDDMVYLINTYGSHPQMFKAPHPVFFVYVNPLRVLTPEQWKEIIRKIKSKVDVILLADYCWDKLDGMFDGLYNYNPGLHAAYGGYAALMKKCRWDVAQANNQISVATVVPGYDEVNPFCTSFDRENGEVYRRGWGYAMKSGAPWVTITTFNEYYEGSEIEPTEEHGRLYIDITREMTDAFKNMPAKEQIQRYFRPNVARGEQWDIQHAGKPEVIGITKSADADKAITKFYRLNGEEASVKTDVSLHYDESALQVRMVCHDQYIKELAVASREKLTYKFDDSVEIMVLPADKGDLFYHFLVNTAGATDRYHRHDPAWNGSSCKVMVRVEKDAWICDVVIPFQALGKRPKKGDIWRMQFCRNYPRKSKCPIEASTAFPTFADYLPAERFGFVRYE